MKKNDIDYPKIEYFINLSEKYFWKEIANENWSLTKDSIEYLKNIVKLYDDNSYNSKLDKYYDLLDFVGKNEVHAIAINIKDLITNIKGNGPHIEHLEEQLKDNISRMKDIIKRFTKNN